jgi:hypothetical protein
MKRSIVVSCFAFLFIFSSAVAAQQDPLPAQSAKRPPWTEDDRKKLLTKAQGGDASSQMWLAAAYEQGWFGEKKLLRSLEMI